MRITKADRINQYNIDNPTYNITKIKKMTKEEYEHWREHSKSLFDLYERPSRVKEQAWLDILIDYKPKKIIGVAGGTMTFSVVLIASNGDILHITRDNNYLVEVV